MTWQPREKYIMISERDLKKINEYLNLAAGSTELTVSRSCAVLAERLLNNTNEPDDYDE